MSKRIKHKKGPAQVSNAMINNQIAMMNKDYQEAKQRVELIVDTMLMCDPEALEILKGMLKANISITKYNLVMSIYYSKLAQVDKDRPLKNIITGHEIKTKKFAMYGDKSIRKVNRKDETNESISDTCDELITSVIKAEGTKLMMPEALHNACEDAQLIRNVERVSTDDGELLNLYRIHISKNIYFKNLKIRVEGTETLGGYDVLKELTMILEIMSKSGFQKMVISAIFDEDKYVMAITPNFFINMYVGD